MFMKRLFKSLACCVLLQTAAGTAVNAEDLKIFGSRVTKVKVGELAAEFKAKTGLDPVVTADVAAVMMRRIEQDEAFDMAVLVDFQIDGLIKKSKLVADTRVDLMRSGIGIAVQRGAKKPDISTVAALKKTLLDAKSITYLKEGASTIQIERLIKEWGMVEALAAKTVKTTGETVSELVAEGKVEIGIIVIPNIMSVPGAEVAGPFPDEIQSWVVFTGAVGEKSAQKAAARALLALLKTPRAAALMKTKGLDPM
jgi:molybdate transport system substrate-binding protein